MGYMQSLWRAINQISHDFDDAPDHESVETLRRALLDMPAPDRIALARELLAGTGAKIILHIELLPTTEYTPGANSAASYDVGFSEGWNACRAAMLGG